MVTLVPPALPAPRPPHLPGPTAAAYCPQAQAALFPHSLIITTPHLASGLIRRPAITLLLSLDGAPFSAQIEGVQVDQVHALAIRPMAARAIQAVGCHLASINVEPGHALFPALCLALQAHSFQVLRADALAACRDVLHTQLIRPQPTEPHAEVIEALLTPRAHSAPRPLPRRHSRCTREQLLAHMDQHAPDRLQVQTLAASLNVSPSRFSHLFVEHVGLPFRTYALWQKYRHAFARLGEHANLSDLACASGFADAAHMTRTFVGYFGFAPHKVRQTSRILDLSQAQHPRA